MQSTRVFIVKKNNAFAITNTATDKDKPAQASSVKAARNYIHRQHGEAALIIHENA